MKSLAWILVAVIGCHSEPAPAVSAGAAAPASWWCHERGRVFHSVCVRTAEECRRHLPEDVACTAQLRAACYHSREGTSGEVQRCAATLTACRYQRSSAAALPEVTVLDECQLVE